MNLWRGGPMVFLERRIGAVLLGRALILLIILVALRYRRSARKCSRNSHDGANRTVG
jgi:hypothetical protein